MSKEGIGTLWLGLGKPQENLKAKDGLPYVITSACGKAKEELHRNSLSEFKRKELTEITSVKGAKKLMEAVRLASSSTKNQPWYLEGTEEEMAVYCKKMSVVKNTLFPLGKKLLQIDMGIALCHLKVTARYLGKEMEFKIEDKPSKKDYEYMITAGMGQSASETGEEKN